MHMESFSDSLVIFWGNLQPSFCPHKGVNIRSAAGLMTFYGPVRLFSCNGSSVISSTLFRLCWETRQAFLQRHIRMCHPGEAGLLVQTEWAEGIISCYQQEQKHKQKAKLRTISQEG